MKTQFNLKDLLMGRDKAYPSDYSSEIEANLLELLEKVNALLKELPFEGPLKVSSGWRPPSVNAATSGAAKKSNHMKGLAVDIQDDSSQSLAKCVLINLDLLIKHGLYLEDPQDTVGKFTNWVHLQSVPPASKKLIFRAK